MFNFIFKYKTGLQIWILEIEELKLSLSELKIDSKPQWGKMTSAQMLKHCNRQAKLYCNEYSSNLYAKFLANTIALLLTNLDMCQAKRELLNSSLVGVLELTTLQSFSRTLTKSRCCIKKQSTNCLTSRSDSWKYLILLWTKIFKFFKKAVFSLD